VLANLFSRSLSVRAGASGRYEPLQQRDASALAPLV